MDKMYHKHSYLVMVSAQNFKNQGWVVQSWVEITQG